VIIAAVENEDDDEYEDDNAKRARTGV